MAGTVITVLAAVYYGPQKMLQTLDWYLDRYDRKVYAVLKNRLMSAPSRLYNPFGAQRRSEPPPFEFPWYVADIAKVIKRSGKSVWRSLRRLEDKGKAERYQGGWRLKT